MQHQTIESQLFSWNGWDEIDVFDLHFYDVTFKTKVGPYNAGDVAPAAALLMSKSTIVVYDNDGNEAYVGRLIVSVEDE